MIDLKIEIEGLNEVLEMLKGFPRDGAAMLQNTVGQDMKTVANILANYPGPKSGSNYTRTGTLGLGWLTAQPEIETTGNFNFNASVKNIVPYAGLVQGGIEDKPSQLRMFAGLWTTTDQVLAQTDSAANQKLESALQDLLNKWDK